MLDVDVHTSDLENAVAILTALGVPVALLVAFLPRWFARRDRPHVVIRSRGRTGTSIMGGGYDEGVPGIEIHNEGKTTAYDVEVHLTVSYVDHQGQRRAIYEWLEKRLLSFTVPRSASR